MKYELITKPIIKNTECLIIGAFAEEEFSELLSNLDQQYDGLVTRLWQKLQKLGDYFCQDLNGNSLILLHCGKKKDFKRANLRKSLKVITGILRKQYLATAVICLPALVEHNAEWQAMQMIMQIDAQFYKLLEFKTVPNKLPPLKLLQLYLPEATAKAIENGQAIAAGINYARYLADLPANVCTPTYLGNAAIELAKTYKNLVVKVMDKEAIAALRMGALLAVAQGSQEQPRLIEIQYHGAKALPPIVLVGKGITFDAGGISLKAANGMDEMKFDMAGAASVFGTIKACAMLKLPVNLVGIIASAENLPSGSAVKPGDIISSMAGKTIEITNTDAEGRLILADALTYAERFNPAFVLDIATLTGAVIIALGHINTGFMTNNEYLAQKIVAAAQAADDKVWRLPLDEEYQEALESTLADLVNASFDRAAGSITAASFLATFTQKYRWAHLDIAGTAWVPGKKRYATGKPVALLIELVQMLAHG